MIDLIAIILTAFAIIMGWNTGLVRQLSSLVGVYVSLVFAWMYYIPFTQLLHWHSGSEKIFSFLLLAFAGMLFISWMASIVTRMLGILKLGVVNRILGVVVSVAKYMMLMGCVLYVLSSVGGISRQMCDESKCYKPLVSLASPVFSLNKVAK